MCTRAEVIETAEMGGETVERVKPPCTRMERLALREEGKEACARAGGWWWGGHRDDPTGTFYHVTCPSSHPFSFTPPCTRFPSPPLKSEPLNPCASGFRWVAPHSFQSGNPDSKGTGCIAERRATLHGT